MTDAPDPFEQLRSAADEAEALLADLADYIANRSTDSTNADGHDPHEADRVALFGE